MVMQGALTGYLGPAEAARRLGLTSQRVIQLAKSGQLASLTTPLGRIVEEAAVERMANARREEAV